MPTSPARIPVLLGTQLLFNVGFYAVVPFLALILAADFALSAAAVGLILGVRTFSQQGMFLLGGVLADRYGARPVILAGCVVRVSGFAILGSSVLTPSPVLAAFVLGTVLTGLGGALFSPGLNVLIADAESRRTDPGAASRASLFAWVSVTGEVGAVLGPLAGAALLGWGFATVALSGAVFFAVIAVVLAWALPSTGSAKRRRTGAGRYGAVRDGRFVRFSALHAADLLAYNQLYLALPLSLVQTPDAAASIAVMFAGASVLVLVLQVPVSRWSARVGPSRALRAGYATSATGFLLVAGAVSSSVDDSALTAAVLAAAALVVLGHLIAHPTALTVVSAFAGTQPTGSYFGLLATCGGIAVLVGNVAVGALLPWSAFPAGAWMLLALALLVAAAATPRRHPKAIGG